MENNIVTPETDENGKVNIADEVITVIAALAASEVKGIAGMSGSFSGGLSELLGKKNITKGVKLIVNEDEITLDLSVIAEYGTKIPDVAWQLQEKVKNEVEAMTGMKVVAVNVSVDGINVPKEDKAEIKTEIKNNPAADSSEKKTEEEATDDEPKES